MSINAIAICNLSVIPVRASADDRSEMVTQLLFGEKIKVLEINNQWLKIEILHDGYQGWVDNKQLIEITSEEAVSLETKAHRTTAVSSLKTPWGQTTVLQGSVPLSTDPIFELGGFNYQWLSAISTHINKDITTVSLSYLNAPYLWGGRTQFGIDCSGFTQTVFHQMGFFLHRDASQQVLQGEEIKLEHAKLGDLAFFISEKTGRVNHVGIILADCKIIHAHGRVRIDTLKPEGIYNEEQKYYSHKLSNVKRYTI